MASVTEERFATPSRPTSCYVDYDERGKKRWETHIRHFHDTRSPLSHTSRRIELRNPENDPNSARAPHENLDDLVTNVYVTHRAHVRSPISRKPLDGEPGKNQKYFIAHSATNCDDLISSIEPSETLLRSLKYRTRLDEETIKERLQTQHILLKNGIRGSYKTDDGVVKLEHTISGSWDRNSEHLQMARRVAAAPGGEADPTAASDYYTGRPDSLKKAKDLAEMVFFGELYAYGKGNAKGLIYDEDNDTWTLNVVIHSVQATSPLYRARRLETEQEQDYVANEQVALKKLAGRGHITLTDPKDPAKTYQVKINPILFSRQVNAMANFSHTLSSPVSGTQASLEISREGWKALKRLANNKLQELKGARGTNRDAVHHITTIIKKLDASYNLSLFQTQMHPAEEMLCLIMLCRLVGLPEVIHCKSSTDRTSFAILSSTLRQWIDLGMRIPRDFTKLLNNPDFKELFAANWSSACHAITRYGRGPHGTIKQNNEDYALDHEKLGLSLNSGVTQNALAARCLPERYLKKYGPLQGTKDLIVKGVEKIWNASYKPCSRLMGRGAVVPAFIATTIGVSVVAALAITRGVWEVGYPFAKWAPESKILRGVALVGSPLILAGRILQAFIPDNNTFWYGTITPPEGRIARWAGSVLLLTPMLIWRLLSPLFTWVKIFPKKVINTEVDSVKKRRLLDKGEYQNEFSEAFREIPAKATSLYDYNEKFENRFLSPIRPVQEVIHADMTSQIMGRIQQGVGESDAEFFERRQDELWENFVSGIKAGFTYTIDGQTFEHERIIRLREENRQIVRKQENLKKANLRLGTRRAEKITSSLNRLEKRRQENLLRIQEYTTDHSYDVAVRIYKYLDSQCRTTEQLWRCIASCQQDILEVGARHTQEMVNHRALKIHAGQDAKEDIARRDGTEVSVPVEVPVTINTRGRDWSMHLENTYSLSRYRETDRGTVKDPVTSTLKVTTGVNLSSGQGDLAWKVKKHGYFSHTNPYL